MELKFRPLFNFLLRWKTTPWLVSLPENFWVIIYMSSYWEIQSSSLLTASICCKQMENIRRKDSQVGLGMWPIVIPLQLPGMFKTLRARGKPPIWFYLTYLLKQLVTEDASACHRTLALQWIWGHTSQWTSSSLECHGWFYLSPKQFGSS